MRRYHIQTFGCQMNVHDSRRMEEVLRRTGFEATEDSSLADLFIVNTCSVREKAVHKLLSLLGTYRMLKEERPHLSIVVAGCVAQQEGEQLLKRAPFIDLVIGPDNIAELPSLLQTVESGAPRARTVFDLDQPQFLAAEPWPERKEVTAYVTVMKGCDERCTFCIVPYTRGSERYRPADEIVREIEQLVAGGVREVTLLGQTVNSWHEPHRSDVNEESQFAALLRRIATEVPGLLRLRYTSPHPRHLTKALIAAHAELPMLPAHMHLPVQSGSDRVLKRMLRRYSRALYIERTNALKLGRPGLTLSTDVIVGFPGESEEDFRQTLSLVEEVGHVAAFGFKYSPRPYTPALKLGDDVPEEVKDERLLRFFEVIEAQQQKSLASLVGTRQSVLIENGRPSKTGGPQFTGRSNRNEIVHVNANRSEDLIGRLVEVEVVQANKHSLQAVLLEALPALPVRSRTRLPLHREAS